MAFEIIKIYPSSFCQSTQEKTDINEERNRELNNNSGDINISLLIVDRTTRQRISKEIEGLNNNINQLDITDVNRVHQSATAEYRFLSGTHGIFSRIDYTFGSTTSLNKFKRM